MIISVKILVRTGRGKLVKSLSLESPTGLWTAADVCVALAFKAVRTLDCPESQFETCYINHHVPRFNSFFSNNIIYLTRLMPGKAFLSIIVYICIIKNLIETFFG